MNMLCFICKGDRIIISVNVGVMKVKILGIVCQDGVIGDIIEVVNSSFNKFVIVEVVSIQEVVVNL